jgi:predicted RNase H-like nuclease
MSRIVAGIDGFEERWLVVILQDGCFAGAHVFDSLSDAAKALKDAVVLAVDTPIGFPREGYGRAAERAAEKLVESRRRSVFSTLPRPVYLEANYDTAKVIAKELTGKSVSRQSHGMRLKMLEAVELQEREPRLIEVHPEVSFRALAGRPLDYAKTTWGGFVVRRQLLCDAGIVIPSDLGSGDDATDPAEAGIDDVLDAAAAAWTADRHARGLAQRLPDSSTPDAEEGVIWY